MRVCVGLGGFFFDVFLSFCLFLFLFFSECLNSLKIVILQDLFGSISKVNCLLLNSFT